MCSCKTAKKQTVTVDLSSNPLRAPSVSPPIQKASERKPPPRHRARQPLPERDKHHAVHPLSPFQNGQLPPRHPLREHRFICRTSNSTPHPQPRRNCRKTRHFRWQRDGHRPRNRHHRQPVANQRRHLDSPKTPTPQRSHHGRPVRRPLHRRTASRRASRPRSRSQPAKSKVTVLRHPFKAKTRTGRLHGRGRALLPLAGRKTSGEVPHHSASQRRHQRRHHRLFTHHRS